MIATAIRERALVIVLAMALVSVASPRADASVLATGHVGAPVLWAGGVAWVGLDGVHVVTPGSPPRLVFAFHPDDGLTYSYALDGGSGAGGASGSLAYGWEEANEAPVPMGPGDANVPAPPIPYGTAVSHRGVIGADGRAAALPNCGENGAPYVRDYAVSVAGGTVAYGCSGIAPGSTPAPANLPPAYVGLSDIGAPGTTAQTIANVSGLFQLSGEFVAYETGNPYGASDIDVENLQTHTVSYQVPQSWQAGLAQTIALQDDGTLVLLTRGRSACKSSPAGTSLAEWFSVASPVAHQLGCFYGGEPRPVGGQWVGLAPAPGAQAALELVDVASGSARTLAVLPNDQMFGGADYDGRQLALVVATCAGEVLQLTADVAALSPGAPIATRCPVVFHVRQPLRPTANGRLRVAVSCPRGCGVADLGITRPTPLEDQFARNFSLPASTKPTIETLRLSRGDLRYLRRHRHVRITLWADVSGLGSAPDTPSMVRVVLAG